MAFTACTGAGSAAHTSLQSGSHRLLLTFLMLVCNMGMWLMKKKTVCLKKQQLITACPESLASHLFIAPLSLI